MHQRRRRVGSNQQPNPYGVPAGAEFDPPWESLLAGPNGLPDGQAVLSEAARLVGELLLEAPDLVAANPRAVARRSDIGDVLFEFREANEVKAGGFPMAVISLSWSGKAEPKMFRRISYFECWSHWEAEGMERDAAEFPLREPGPRQSRAAVEQHLRAERQQQDGPACPREVLASREDQHQRGSQRVEAVADAGDDPGCREPGRAAHRATGRAPSIAATISGTSGVGSMNSIGTNTSWVGAVQALPTGNRTRAATM